HWQHREALFFWGAPLAVVPALGLLPAFAFLVLTPAFAYARIAAVCAFPILVLGELWGISKLVRCFIPRPFDLLTALSFGSFAIVLLIAIYTGIFLAVAPATLLNRYTT